jgi:Fe-S-cluster containining protein
LKDEIEHGQEPEHHSIRDNCLIASRHLLTHKTTRKFIDQSDESLSNNPAHLNLISDWYSSLKLACPFLQHDNCTIYKQRPMACREHYIIGSAGMCDSEDCNVEVLDMPIRVSDALGQLASELEGTTIEAVILPLVFLWCDENNKRAERTWPFEMMVTRFVEIIKAAANKNSAIAV